MGNRPGIDVEKLKEETQKRQDEIRTEREAQVEVKTERILEVAKEETDKITAKLPALLEYAVKKGRNNIRIYTDRISARRDFKPVDIMRLKDLVIKDVIDYCWQQGLNVHDDSGYPRSEDCYESWIAISW